MKWRCVNKEGYCSGEPTNPQINHQSWGSGSTCELDPETCGKYKSSQQLWNELPQEEKDRVSEPSCKEIVVHKGEGVIEKETKPKPKTKRAKKLESEIVQRSMF